MNLEVGQKVKFDGNPRWWTVKAITENFAALTQQAPGYTKDVLQYTVCDWRNGVRGPCDLVGQGYGDGSYTEAECEEMLAEFEFDEENDPARLAALAAGEKSWTPTGWRLQVSHRNRVPIRISEGLA